MNINDSVLKSGEKIVFCLRELYAQKGFLPYRMSKFEEYDLYAKNKDFLVSDNVITFTDSDGKLMALKPDVTLSIIKNSVDEPDVTRKVFYDENVYRAAGGDAPFREILQMGVECFGAVGKTEVDEVLSLAAESLRSLGEGGVLAVSDLDLLESVVDRLALGSKKNAALYQAISEKNRHEIAALCADCADTDAVDALLTLAGVYGTPQEVLPALDGVFAASEAYENFRAVLSAANAAELRVDFSILNDVNYYNGIVFKGFLPGVPEAVLSGGQYDRLMQKMKRRSNAIGFAVYTDALERVDEAAAADDGFINVALPKGRLGERVYKAFAKAGFPCPSILEPNRKLIFENPEKRVRYFWVKPSDVAIYVERGAADVGVCGKDILLEYEPDVYELVDLHTGVCKMAVAAPKGFSDDTTKTLRVATKFSNIAKDFYRKKGRDIDFIHLNGSIEIAPILGLSDVIVDIVETGATLRENNLEVIEDIVPISARLISNKASFKFKSEAIEHIAAGLAANLEEDK
ncbi:MAG: ATP phosphoribosyltransferase [Clostridia bacterium]|nr:ATP phosphoribosyltransferase [Clostridia bacterium]